MRSFQKACLYTFLICGVIAAIVETSSIAKAAMISPLAESKNAFSNMSSDKRFQYAMRTVLRHEGGLSNDKADSGSWTRYGISLRFLKGENLDVNGDGRIDKEDILHLTLTEADAIYYKDFYIRNHYDQIKNEEILTKILDFSINAGSYQCNKIVKRALNRITDTPVAINGELDAQTIKLINSSSPKVLYSALVAEEESFYFAIVKKNPHLSVFLHGWLIRCNDL